MTVIPFPDRRVQAAQITTAADDTDDLAPARGIAAGLAISAVMWTIGFTCVALWLQAPSIIARVLR